MNSIYEGRGLESHDEIIARLGDAICSECGWLAIHKDECSKSH